MSGCKVSGLSEHNSGANHVEFKGPNKDDPVIRFDIGYYLGTKDGTIGFK